MSLLMKFFT